MKKLFLIAGITLGLSASAQTEKGSWMVGTNFSNLNLGFASSTNNVSFNISPNLAYFVSDNFAFGGQVDLGISKAKGSDARFNFGLQPLARYYFTKQEKNGIFGQATVGFEGASVAGTSTTGLTFSIGAGWNYWLNKSVALEVGARYINVDKKVAGLSLIPAFENNINLNFGLQIFLPKKTASQVKSSYRKK